MSQSLLGKKFSVKKGRISQICVSPRKTTAKQQTNGAGAQHKQKAHTICHKTQGDFPLSQKDNLQKQKVIMYSRGPSLQDQTWCQILGPKPVPAAEFKNWD